MARKDRRAQEGAERLRALLQAGDHRRARTVATALLGDPAAGDTARAEAASALASLAPEPGAVVAGALGLAVAVAIAAWTIAAG
jgi:hypothetical protein